MTTTEETDAQTNEGPDALLDGWQQLRRSGEVVRQRDAADALEVPEAALAFARVGRDATALQSGALEPLLKELGEAGPLMGLTRNPHAVIEKVGHYRNIELFEHAGNVLDEGIDLRVFHRHWRHWLAVADTDRKGRPRHSLQFFDASGTAVHKVYSTESTDMEALERIVQRHKAPEQHRTLELEPPPERRPEPPDDEVNVQTLRSRWEALTDTHQFFFLLRELGVGRVQALRLVGPAWARRTRRLALRGVLEWARDARFRLMVFVGNRGVLQIHTGTVDRLAEVGDWYNVLDPGFSLHLYEPRIASAWVVRKPTDTGIVTSLELYDEDGETVLLTFPKREPGSAEPEAWTRMMEGLPTG